MAASIASMAQRKRKLADLSVDEFMSGEFDPSSSDSEPLEKPSSKKKDKKNKGLVTGHKQSLQKLKDSDPEFYQFLQDQDKSLLDFDASDEDKEEESDGDLEDEESDSEEDEKKDKNSKNKEEEDDIDFDMSGSDSDDEDDNIHRPPAELEVMSGSSDEEEDNKEEGKEKQKRKSQSRLVTMAMIKDWTQRFKDSISPNLIHEVTSALKAAVQHVAGEAGTTKYRVEGSKAFNAIIRLCLIEIAPALQKMLDLPPLKDLQKPILPKTKNKKWMKVHIDIKNYLTSVLQLMTQLSDASMVNVILKHIHRMVGYYACFPKLTKLLMKKVIVVWSTGEETSRVLAFLCINRLVLVKQEELLETCIKQMYMAYVKNCKFTSPNTLPMINFMQRTLVELFAINFGLTYEYAFIYIRQLAIHLRNAITLKKKESVQAVYNWQYIHCIGLWVRVQTTLYPNDVLDPLIYPLTQIIIGTIKLVPTARYYPLLPPTLQIDIPQEIADKIIDHKYERSPYLFRESQLIVFRYLFGHWNDFCNFRANLAEEKIMPTIERRRKHAKVKDRKRQQELEERLAKEEKHEKEAERRAAMGLSVDDDDAYHDPFQAHEGSDREEHEAEDKDKVAWSYSKYISSLETEELLNNTDETSFSSLLTDSASVQESIASDGDKQSAGSKQSGQDKKVTLIEETQTGKRRLSKASTGKRTDDGDEDTLKKRLSSETEKQPTLTAPTRPGSKESQRSKAENHSHQNGSKIKTLTKKL